MYTNNSVFLMTAFTESQPTFHRSYMTGSCRYVLVPLNQIQPGDELKKKPFNKEFNETRV